jgi:hypothetical protein
MSEKNILHFLEKTTFWFNKPGFDQNPNCPQAWIRTRLETPQIIFCRVAAFELLDPDPDQGAKIAFKF